MPERRLEIPTFDEIRRILADDFPDPPAAGPDDGPGGAEEDDDD